MRTINRRGAEASKPLRHLPRIVGVLAVSTALLAPVGSATAAPQSVRQPAMRPVDDQGLLDSVANSVANRSTQLISTVRDGTSNLIDSAMNFLGVRYIYEFRRLEAA